MKHERISDDHQIARDRVVIFFWYMVAVGLINIAYEVFK